VKELINGHPEHIHCELGSQTCFWSTHCLPQKYRPFPFAICDHWGASIFLYKCITGLSIWHVSECFQCSNDTISESFHHHHSILIMSLYQQQMILLHHTLEATWNSSLFLKMLLVQLKGPILPTHPQPLSEQLPMITKVGWCKTASLPAIST
jgi:hypothetical protein